MVADEIKTAGATTGLTIRRVPDDAESIFAGAILVRTPFSRLVDAWELSRSSWRPGRGTLGVDLIQRRLSDTQCERERNGR